MKRLSLVLAIAALALPQAGQAGWWRTYGGEGYDVGNCVQITSDGNYIITGAPWVLLKVDTSGNVVWSQKYTGFIGKWVEQTPDSGFIVASWNPTLLRADAQGDSLWTRSYGIYSYCVQPTSDDGYIVTGGTNGYGNDEELIIVKTDSQGDSLWSKRYTEPGNNKNVGYFIQETNEGGFVITGFTGYSDEYVYYSKVWIIKIDSEGTKLWSKMYGTADNNTGFCVRQTKDNGYIITGISSGGIYLLKTSSTGDTVWSKAYGVSNQGTGHNIQQTSDGGYIIEGSTETLFNTKSSLAVRDLWLVKTDSLGDTL